jgi:ATP-dependent DNA ligase
LTAQASPRTIFRRAIEHGNLMLAEVTARELGRMTLEEALLAASALSALGGLAHEQALAALSSLSRVGSKQPLRVRVARPAPFPSDAGYAFELKWDGFRAIVRSGGAFRVRSHRGWNDAAPAGARCAAR